MGRARARRNVHAVPRFRYLVSYPIVLAAIALCCFPAASAHAQDNYEIQVYGADTVAPKTTMLELHSNFTADGSKPLPGSQFAADGLYPTNHAEHETIEITQGINNWSEVGFNGLHHRSCGRWAFNGVVVLRRARRRWEYVTSGSARLPCGRLGIPGAVRQDLHLPCAGTR